MSYFNPSDWHHPGNSWHQQKEEPVSEKLTAALFTNLEAALELSGRAVARDVALGALALTHVIAEKLGDENLDRWLAGRRVGIDAVTAGAAGRALVGAVESHRLGKELDAEMCGLIAGAICRFWQIQGGGR